MWNGLLLFIGLVLGYLASSFDNRWLIKQNWSMALLEDWAIMFFLVLSLYSLCIFFPLYKLVNSKGKFLSSSTYFDYFKDLSETRT